MSNKKEPSPEVKAVITDWVKLQREKYGENWKETLAKEMAEQTAPILKSLLNIGKKP